MNSKLFEIRDRGTFIPVLATAMNPSDVPEQEAYLLRRSGFGFDSDCVVLCRCECSGTERNATYDPFAWTGRTFPVAHKFIAENFNTLKSGQVVDVEYILGETETPKQSERITD